MTTKTLVGSTDIGIVIPPTGIAASDTANIQALHDVMPSTGGTIRLREGDYAITADALTLTKPCRLVGNGRGKPNFSGGVDGGTRLLVNSTTGNGLVIDSDGVTVQNLAVVNTASTDPTAGAGIKLTNASHALIENCSVVGFYDNIDASGTSGYYWRLVGCMILDPVRNGIWVRNTDPDPSGDWGDPEIASNVITCYTSRNPTGSALYWESGGGMRVHDNKVNSGPGSGGSLKGKFVNGFYFSAADGKSSVDFFVNNNSIENYTGIGVFFGIQGTTGSVSRMFVRGNNFQPTGSSGTGVKIGATAYGLWAQCRHGVIDDNHFFNCVNGIVVTHAGFISVGEHNHHESPLDSLVVFGVSGANQPTPLGSRCRSQVVGYNGSGGIQDNIAIFEDNRGHGNNAVAEGTGPQEYTRGLYIANTSAVTCFTLENASANAWGRAGAGGKIEVEVVGGGFATDQAVHLQQTRAAVLGYGTSTISLATIGTDHASGGNSAHVTVTYDTATANKVIIKVAVDNASGSAQFYGEIKVRVSGLWSKIKRGS